MNKTQKRQQNLRNKLFAAIAMLLVSSIMMVSTTYAWFTLSTAPEVQGITTTVGANGNLEIALSPRSGDSDEITSAMGDSTIESWALKNLTWGNLLDLSDDSYHLDEIALLPTRLNATGTTELDLSEFPLQTPVYGADGRVSGLEADTYIGTKWKVDAETEGNPIVAADDFIANDYRGVRAVGTANNMSEYQSALNSARSNLSIQIGSVQDNAEGSLTANGGVLTQIAILHATADDDTNDYAEYVPTLRSVVNSLKLANSALDQAIRSAIRAMSASASSSKENFDAVKAALDAESTDLTTIWTEIGGDITVTDTALETAYNTWSSIDSKLNKAGEALVSAEELVESSTDVAWSDVCDVLSQIMDTSGDLEIDGKDLTELQDILKIWKAGEGNDNTGDGELTYEDTNRYNDAMDFVGGMASGVDITLGEGTGVYYDFATVVGNLDASFTTTVSYDGMKLPNVPATMKTNAPGNGAMNTVKQNLAALDAIESDDSSFVIDETYGYIVDFFFRTNATGSKLKLLTNAAQRIYSDSANTNTLGHGSTMTFRTGAVSETTLQGLMGAIRVVFFNPSSRDIFGIAKLDTNLMTRNVIVDNTAEGVGDIVDVTAPLKLYEVTRNETSGVLEFGTEITEANATLCDLQANTATALSVLVYLDGDNITNEDVASSGKSAVGTLNLQFGSDATLAPMTNTDLKTGTGLETSSISFVNNTSGEKAATVVVNKVVVEPEVDYTFSLTGTGTYTVTYKVGDTDKGTLTPTGNTYTIPGIAAAELEEKAVVVTINAVDTGDDE